MSQVCACAISNKTTEERSRETRRAAELTQRIHSAGNLSVKNRTYHLKTYYSCFIASELVDWLISSGEAEDRRKAVQLGQLLLETDFIHHVVDEHNFEDGYLFFRFRQDEPPQEAMQGPSVAYIKGEQGTLISLLARKKPVIGWTYNVFALSPSNKMLYQFKSELDSFPMKCFTLECVSVQPFTPKNGGRCILQFFMNQPTGRVKSLCLAADSSETQFTWIRQLASIGVEIMPSMEEEDSMIQTAETIFEFEALDIENRLVPLSQYRGHVTLIVNVASS